MSSDRPRAQSETLGFILVFALVLAGAALTVAIGGSGITDSQSNIEFQRAENSMTLFDSRAAMVALGNAETQKVSLGHDDGTITLDDESGWLRVTHTNYTENDKTTHEETIYNETLGQVVYESDRGTIAYQGGGVWKIEGGGAAQMVSPPEFHYRGATLTLPTIQINGEGAASGSVNMQVESQRNPQLVYPNKTDLNTAGPGAPYDKTANSNYTNYTNPVGNGTVRVTVNSEYSEGWESYFKERTTGNVTRLGENTVQLTLKTLGEAPDLIDPLPDHGDSLGAGSVAGGHPLTNFSTELNLDKKNSHFSFYTEEERQYELHVYSETNPNNKKCEGDAHISVYYNNTKDKGYQSWESDMLDPKTTDGMELNCSSGETYLDINFISDNITMTYDPVGDAGNFQPNPKIDDPNKGGSTPITLGNKWAYNVQLMNASAFNTSTTWDQHGNVTYEPITINQNGSSNDTRSLKAVNNHYFGLLGKNIEFVVKNGPASSSSVDHADSQARLNYNIEITDEYINYLHITKNEIEVRLGARG